MDSIDLNQEYLNFNKSNDSSNLDIEKQFFRDLSRYKTLSSEETNELIKQYKNGNIDAKKKIVEGNLRLIIIPARIMNIVTNIDFLDLYDYGLEGLYKAIDNFDLKFDVKFSTYAVRWIKKSISYSINKYESSLKKSVNANNIIKKINNCKVKFYKEYGKNPSYEQISDLTEISKDKVKEYLTYDYKIVSLDSSQTFDSEELLLDMIASEIDIEEEEIKKIQCEELYEIINQVLNEKEKLIIRMYFGLDTHSRTLKEIAKELNCTHQEIGRIKKTALTKLKNKFIYNAAVSRSKKLLKRI